VVILVVIEITIVVSMMIVMMITKIKSDSHMYLLSLLSLLSSRMLLL